jgi:hypothetical protein
MHRRPVRPITAAAVVLAALALSAVAAPRASASPGVLFGLTDDAWLTDGPGTVQARVAQLQALGVQIVRYTLVWSDVARSKPANATDPTDPAYDWSGPDGVLNALRAAGMPVLLQVYGTPRWANGGRGPNYAPTSSSTFAAFAKAAARRYRWVKQWLIWNEPNQVRWLRPTTPFVYVSRLLNPAYAAIHSTIGGAKVGGGSTAPRGSTGGVSPVAWIDGMRRAHARLDAYAHNPYPLDPKHESPTSGGCARCTTITMATIGKLVALVAHDWPRARIWLSEYGYQTNPPDRILGVPYALQARYLGEGAYVAWKTPRVDLLIHFLYRDEPNVARFQSGLVTFGNARKPSFAAFEVPLVEVARAGTRTTLWGQLRAPAAGATATIQRKVGAAWRTLATLHATPHGYFRWTGTLPSRAIVRVRAGPIVGPPLAVV